MPISIPPCSESVNTLKSALIASGLPWLGNSDEVRSRYRVELGDGPEIYEVIRNVIHPHAIEGAGLSGGPIEFYPLADGATFTVDWGEASNPNESAAAHRDTHAILTIVRLSKAY
jgi:hypothetical protein